jgi:hypothetical protein
MSAALVDLVSKGAQDVYITGDPEVSFFRQNFRRHTNFAIKPERVDYIGQFNGGAEVTIPIKSKGDLLSYVWIEAPDIQTAFNTDTELQKGLFATGQSATEFTLLIGGQQVCKLDSLFIQGVHNVLYNDTSAKASCAATTALVSANAKSAIGTRVGSDYFVIPFFFSEDWTKALPLVAMQYHEVEIRIKCRSGLAFGATPKVYANYVYLDTDERNRLLSTEQEILITQTQHQIMDTSSSGTVDVDLTYFNHPSKAIHLISSAADGTAWDNELKFDSATLYINGQPLFEDMSDTYHHNVVPEMHCTVLPSGVIDSVPLFTWPFCIKLNGSQPSGSLNFSRVDNSKLVLKNLTVGDDPAPSMLRVYTVNYNILRVKNGLAGVAFGN